jgi:DNA-binding transcriptional ArsR family regulator
MFYKFKDPHVCTKDCPSIENAGTCSLTLHYAAVVGREGKTLENLSQATGLSPATATYYVSRLRQVDLVRSERQGH